MTPFCDGIGLHVAGRISAEDAARQQRTAREILARLHSQPGLVLADEVGTGKTFVALAVAVSVAVHTKRPVVVMVPSALREKWPRDFGVFRDGCLPAELRATVRGRIADRAVDFLKLLDDPPESQASVIFLTHGAMHRNLTSHSVPDKLVMLALIRRSLYRRHAGDKFRNAVARAMPDLLQMQGVERNHPGLLGRLLDTDPADWRKWTRHVEGVGDDDPIPAAIRDALPDLNTDAVYAALGDIPINQSKYYSDRITAARQEIKAKLKTLWAECMKRARLRLPLLILDEAHHLKNADTQLASLFQSEEAVEDAEVVARGPLAGVFERMLFLTATPFQLGHAELCSVLDRFDGVTWDGPGKREQFSTQRQELRAALDAAQEAAVTLDHAWGRLTPDDLRVGDHPFADVDQWWPQAAPGGELTSTAGVVLRAFQMAKEKLKAAETLLRPWVLRHLKARHLPGTGAPIPRRQRAVGKAIRPGSDPTDQTGLPVEGEALLPFLLAARAALSAPDSRPVFAEGLASSYEAFLHTRQGTGTALDTDDDPFAEHRPAAAADWYLSRLDKLIPRDGRGSAGHPKVDATVARVVDLWNRGEKVLVFCHFVATGKTLRQRISDAVRGEIRTQGANKLGCPISEVEHHLEQLGNRFFDADSPVRRACDDHTRQLIAAFPALSGHHDDLSELVRRNLRTPSFLVRYFPLDRGTLDADAMLAALETRDASGLTLRDVLRQFLAFLAERCGSDERKAYIGAVQRIQTGSHFGRRADAEYEADELQGATAEGLVPDVRLVNGTTRRDTRQRLMLTFNTPFYPDVLVASSVMAEGVDLHRHCRHVLHHDLRWNPSDLEQRTGRVDRIGAKAEQAGRPVQVDIPFVAQTQDEKMYRVVTDRERWFGVLMGEEYAVDARSTETIAARIPLPAEAAAELAFRLGVTSDL